MHHAFLVPAPSHFWASAHFPKDNVNMLHVFVPKTFKDTIRDRSPGIICGELYLYSKPAKDNVGKTVGVGSEVNGYLELAQQRSDYFANTIFEGLRDSERLAFRALESQAGAQFIK
ncbi:MAG: hypothetical protein AAB433_09025 [Nitrospirota bacterium]